MKLKLTSDLWIVAILFVFTFVIAYVSSLIHEACFDVTSAPGVWEMTSWPIKVALFQLLAAFLLFVFSMSRRFVRPVAYVEEPPRAQSEYVTSMANLVRRAGRKTLIVDTLYKRFRYEILMKTALSPEASDAQIISSLKAQHPEYVDRVQDILNDAQKFQQVGDGSHSRDLMKWSRKIAEVRRTWRRGS